MKLHCPKQERGGGGRGGRGREWNIYKHSGAVCSIILPHGEQKGILLWVLVGEKPQKGVAEDIRLRTVQVGRVGEGGKEGGQRWGDIVRGEGGTMWRVGEGR